MKVIFLYISACVVKWSKLTPLRRSALALACLKRGSSFVMVYWCNICSVFALYTSWNWRTVNEVRARWYWHVHRLQLFISGPYVALQFLALLCMFDREVVGHLRKLNAVRFLPVFGLREEKKKKNPVCPGQSSIKELCTCPKNTTWY